MLLFGSVWFIVDPFSNHETTRLNQWLHFHGALELFYKIGYIINWFVSLKESAFSSSYSRHTNSWQISWQIGFLGFYENKQLWKFTFITLLDCLPRPKSTPNIFPTKKSLLLILDFFNFWSPNSQTPDLPLNLRGNLTKSSCQQRNDDKRK